MKGEGQKQSGAKRATDLFLVFSPCFLVYFINFLMGFGLFSFLGLFFVLF